MLAKFGKADFAKLLELTADTDPVKTVIALFNEPETMQGKLVALTGTARRAVFAAEDALSRFTQRLEQLERLSAETLDVQLNRQQQLAAARISENQALAEYNIALEQLERAKGTLLRYNNIILQEEKGPMFARTLHLPWIKPKPAAAPQAEEEDDDSDEEIPDPRPYSLGADLIKKALARKRAPRSRREGTP